MFPISKFILKIKQKKKLQLMELELSQWLGFFISRYQFDAFLFVAVGSEKNNNPILFKLRSLTNLYFYEMSVVRLLRQTFR